jgi:hypothetical protein
MQVIHGDVEGRTPDLIALMRGWVAEMPLGLAWAIDVFDADDQVSSTSIDERKHVRASVRRSERPAQRAVELA